ncbi:MAG: GNAT family N-acetyltransferase, partial [Actinobacteria bacterium]|nr:GNAT family N-acetyltransferase [Actinomycetota bacterium]
MTRTYPAHREADVVLRDGSTVRMRPVRPEDVESMRSFLELLSTESRALRFFTGSPNLELAARWSVDIDYLDRYGVVATRGDNPEIVGEAAYRKTNGDSAEVAFAVADAYQGRGLGTLLLAHLAEVAEANGIATFTAQVLPQNHRMIEVFRDSGFSVRARSEPGLVSVEFATSLTSEGMERFDERERIAALSAVAPFFAPRSVAVIGASRERGTIGGAVFHNLLEAGFNGPVYPINPKADVVQSVAAYASVLDAPGPVDLAVIAVPARLVEVVARECASKGVKGLVVISAGFSETGEEGIRRQRELVTICRAAGMRLIGPNCMGILNAAPSTSLNATFAPLFPPHGHVGFLSQSGALGLAVIDHAKTLGLGISSFASVGNKADISGNDLIQYWETDDDTSLILLYLESFGNPRTFSRIARRIGRTKPVIAVKSGRSAAGARATSSHTGALIAASDVTVDALFEQTGVIRTDTLEEMFEVATLLANQPPPEGKRVAIITNAGGPAILCADACEADGLEVTPLSGETRAKLAHWLPAEASLGNPVDMIASATGEDYRRAIDVVAADEDVDAVIVIFIPPLVTLAAEVASAIRRAATELPRNLPLLAVFMSARGVPQELRGEGSNVPSYAFPEDAARALARSARYGVWRRTPEGTVPSFEDCRRDEGAAVISQALAAGTSWMGPGGVARLLDCYRLPLAEWRLASSPEEAARAAGELEGEVALKAVAPDLVHKTEANAVRLGLAGTADVSRAAADMEEELRRAGYELESFFVQRMVPPGVEMLVGVVHDQSFGPVVACGAGGVAVELLKDVAVRIAPLSDTDAHNMVRSLATYPLLDGYRGAPPADVGALEQVLLRISALVETHSEIVEMDCNPVVVSAAGAVIVDARIRVEKAAPRAPI